MGKPKIGVAAGLLVLVVGVAGLAVVARGAEEPPLSDVAALKTMGISVTDSTEASNLDAAQAAAAAGKAEGLDLANSASGARVASVRKVRFNAARTSEQLVPKNALVWVVTVDGLSLSSTNEHSPAPGTAAVHSQLNVVIDANTGAFIQDYTYR